MTINLISKNRAQRHEINETIKSHKVLLIDQNNKNCGIVSKIHALRLAKESNLDLVVVSQGSEYPVCHIMDYGKFKYEQSRKQSKQNQNKTSLKEVKIRPVIEEHDYQVKLRSAHAFLEGGNQVKVIMKFRGREVIFKDQGIELLNKFADNLSDCSKIDKFSKFVEGNQIILLLSPKSRSAQIKN